MIFPLRALNYLKALASLIGAVSTALSLRYTDNETLTIIVIVSSAILTWAVPNIDAVGDSDPEDHDEPDEVDPDDVNPEDYDYLPFDQHGGTGDSTDEVGPYSGDVTKAQSKPVEGVSGNHGVPMWGDHLRAQRNMPPAGA